MRRPLVTLRAASGPDRQRKDSVSSVNPPMLSLVACWVFVGAAALTPVAGAAVVSTDATARGMEGIIVRSLPAPGALAGEHPEGTAAVRSPRGCMDLPRSEVDRPDVVEGPSVHIVYLVAADSPDQLLDTRGTLNCTIKAQNQWLQEQSELRWNFDMFVHERHRKGRTSLIPAVDVTFARSSLPAAKLGGAAAVRDELIRLGFAQPEKRYLTYVMGQYTTFCGDAIYPLSVHADGHRDGVYAQVYLSSTNACNAQWFGKPGQPSWSDAIAQQELLHTEGLTAIGAPHSCPMVLPFAHICTAALFYTDGSVQPDPEQTDLMYPYVSLPLSQKVLDRGHDDYFGHDLPLGDLGDSPYLVPAKH